MKMLLAFVVLFVSVTLLQTQVEAAGGVELVQPNPGKHGSIAIHFTRVFMLDAHKIN